MFSAALAIGLFEWRYFHDGIWSWDLAIPSPS